MDRRWFELNGAFIVNEFFSFIIMDKEREKWIM